MFGLADYWKLYMSSVGIGFVNTINAPPGTTGKIPDDLTSIMLKFGELIKPLSNPAVSASATEGSCARINVELDMKGVEFNTLVLRENLDNGQRIARYTIEYQIEGDDWKAYPTCQGKNFEGCVHGQSVAAMLVESLPYQQGLAKIRFRCLESFANPVGLSSFGAVLLAAPAGAQAKPMPESLITLSAESIHDDGVSRAKSGSRLRGARRAKRKARSLLTRKREVHGSLDNMQ